MMMTITVGDNDDHDNDINNNFDTVNNDDGNDDYDFAMGNDIDVYDSIFFNVEKGDNSHLLFNL